MPRHKYTREQLEAAAQVSVSVAGVLRQLGIKQAGGSQSHITRKLRDYEIDISHFTGMAHNRGKKSIRRLSPADILVKMPAGSSRTGVIKLRRALVESGVKMSCTMCGLGVEWNGSPIVLEIDHINDDFLDNRLENLQFLCPNCHSQKTKLSYLKRKTMS